MTRDRWLQTWVTVATVSMLLAAAIAMSASASRPPNLLLALLPAFGGLISGVGITMLL